jgi:DNA polymerase-3 subunit gamma/tau
LSIVARKAEGSMRDALSLLDQVCSYGQESIGEKEVRSILGLVDSDVYASIMDSISSKDPGPVLKVVQDILYRGFDLQEFIVGLEEYIRALLFAAIPHVLDNPRIDLRAETMDIGVKTAQFSEKALLRMAEIVRKTETELKWSVFPRFLVEITLLKLVYLDSTVSVEQLLRMVKGPLATPPPPVAGPSAERVSPGVQEKKKSDITPPLVDFDPIAGSGGAFEEGSVTAPLDAAELIAQWPLILEAVQKERPMLGHYLRVAKASAHSNGALDVRFPQACNAQYAEASKSKNREDLNRIMLSRFGALVDVHITIEPPGPSPVEGAKVETASVSINDEIAHEPIIKSVLDIFNGEVID